MVWNLSNAITSLVMAGITALTCYLYVYRWGHYALSDQANSRSLHKGRVLTSGGLFFVLPIWLWVVYMEPSFWPWWGVLLMLLVGLADDVWRWSAKPKLFCQILVSFLLVSVLGFWQEPLLAATLLLMLLWWLNLFNFMDGANGIASLHAMVALVLYAVLMPPEMAFWADVAVVLLSSLTVFLIFNLRQGCLFMGDAGSLPLAYIQAIMGLLMMNVGILTLPLLGLVHAVFIADTSFTLIVRIKEGEKLSQGHNNHLYQRLVKYGWSHNQVAYVYASVSVVLACVVGWLIVLPVWQHWFALVGIYLLLLLIFIKTFRLGR